jgi:pimeloyl-ACP methyl ester carboxylesterase
MAKMNIEKRNFRQTPALLVYNDDLTAAVNQGTSICSHGLNLAKNEWLHDLEILAQDGFLLVAIDNVGHGDRRYADFEERLGKSAVKKDSELIGVIKETAAEVPGLVAELLEKKLALPGKTGMFGVSLGGFITYAAISEGSRIDVAASLVGSPEWWMQPSEKSPYNQPQKFCNVKLLSLTAGQDKLVPAGHAEAFHARLKESYADYEQRFKYVSFPDSGHFMQKKDWRQALKQVTSWFKLHFVAS